MKRGGEISIAARKSINWLYESLKKREYGLRFQKKSEVKVRGISETNDDQVLDCAESLLQSSEAHVVVVTNDKNLAVKAMVANVLTVSGADFSEDPEDLIKQFSFTES